MVLRPIPTKREEDAHGSLFERKILVKSPEPGIKAQRKVEKLSAEIITENYQQKLLQKIISRNYYRKLSANISMKQKMRDL